MDYIKIPNGDRCHAEYAIDGQVKFTGGKRNDESQRQEKKNCLRSQDIVQVSDCQKFAGIQHPEDRNGAGKRTQKTEAVRASGQDADWPPGSMLVRRFGPGWEAGCITLAAAALCGRLA
jgi:hypothetical protein